MPYNQINLDEKYLIYSPSGGFNNQREELESAVEVAFLLNRTLFVPMAGKHTSFWMRYGMLRPERNEVVPMDHVLDLDYLGSYETGVRLVPLNNTIYRLVSNFVKVFGPKSVSMISPKDMKSAEVLKLRSNRQPLIYLHGKGMYHLFFAISTMVKVRRRTRYAPHMRQMALRVAMHTFPEGFDFVFLPTILFSPYYRLSPCSNNHEK